MEHTKIKSFTDLVVWQEAHKLVLVIYNMTKSFPKEEIFGLINQMRRAAVSITSNIAEGFSRQHYPEKIHFYSISQGSTTELQSQLFIVRDVGYINEEVFNNIFEQSVSVNKLLSRLIAQSKQNNTIT